MVKNKKGNLFLTVLFTVISLLWIFPIIEVVLNSFKRKAYISREPFGLPTGKMFEGLKNYINGIEKTDFFRAFGLSLLVTVLSVAVLLLCTSMCAWYIVRVKSVISSVMFHGFVFSMIVPFQMVMFTLSKIANMLKLTTPLGLVLVYLGFGAGLCVFMFTGFVKSIPLEIEESAMIDGCNPIQAYFQIVLPIMKPTCITVAILEAMERLPSSAPGTGQRLSDDSHCHPVSEGRTRIGGYGSDDGNVGTVHYSDCYILYDLSEIYH